MWGRALGLLSRAVALRVTRLGFRRNRNGAGIALAGGMQLRRALFVLFLVPTLASAQEGTLNNFAPGETVTDDFHLSRPTDLGHLRFGARLTFDYANDPLVVEGSLGDRGSEQASAVEHQFNATVGLSLGLLDRLTVYAGIPVVLVNKGEDLDPIGFGAVEPDGPGAGDLYLGARARILGEDGDSFVLGAQLTAHLPTSGSSDLYRGEESFSIHPELLVQGQLGSVRVVANLGAQLRPESDGVANLEHGSELTFGLGIAAPLETFHDGASHLDIHAQIYGSSTFANFFDREATPLEATAGLKLHHRSGVVAGLAGGAGITRGFGSPDGRVIAMVGYQVPEDEPAATEDDDRDDDGIADADDECPDEPEDIDTFEDENGCPDPDNDADGIADGDDECPLEAETVNEVDDEDGCPDVVGDRDNDGIPDTTDACPTEPEDADGFEDDNGCPDPDNDGDGVLDADDQCRDVAGTAAAQGCPDRDGDGITDRVDNCPDEAGTAEHQGCTAPQRVVIQEGRLEILDKVFFRTNRDVIQRRSFALLDNVATILNNHPEIEHIRVEGHTDARGDHDYNVALSQRRAEAVVRYLVEHGVTESRLEAVGYGPDRPRVQDATTDEQHSENRRVEFNIVGEHAGVQEAAE